MAASLRQLRHNRPMAMQVAFLRAINVGNRRVSMDRLRGPFEELGFDDVSTFIASGNVVFSAAGKAASLEADIEKALAEALGFEVPAFVRRVPDLKRVVDAQPFDPAAADAVHVGFLKRPPTPAVRSALEAAGNEVDEVAVRGREIYWLAREGMGRARLSGAALEKIAGGPTTLRSLKMLRRLHTKLKT